MLGKELKIENLMIQREFIRKQLMQPNKDGDPSYLYVGQLFLENIRYFEEEGMAITPITIDNSKFRGLPAYLFTCKVFELNDDEMKESEKSLSRRRMEEEMEMVDMKDIFEELFGQKKGQLLN